MPGVTMTGVVELVKLDNDLKKLARDVFPKAAASACNISARWLRSNAQKQLQTETGLPARIIGRRLLVTLADARPESQKLWSRVRGYQGKVSASYRRDGLQLQAQVMKKGARLGKAQFPGAWRGHSKRYNRDFIGARTTKRSDSMYFPSVDMEQRMKSVLEKRSEAANKMQQDELAAQVEKRLAKFAVGAI